MAWFYLLLAGFFETGFAVSLKLMDGHKNIPWVIVFYISIAFSLLFLSMAMKTIPIGTAYGVWTGIGTAGVVLVGYFFLGESMSVARAGFLLMLIIAIIGLKVSSSY
jgi:quaternary ammonium compound-resistance protein SugE